MSVAAIRCTECGRRVDPADPTLVRRTVPTSNLMSQQHKTRVAFWHTACWDEAERFAAQSRADAQAQQLADMREMVAGLSTEARERALARWPELMDGAR